jgi:hypothetical protein
MLPIVLAKANGTQVPKEEEERMHVYPSRLMIVSFH